MNLPLSKCIPAAVTLSIEDLESAVDAYRRGDVVPQVEYQPLPGGLFLITRGCAVCAAAAFVQKPQVAGVRTQVPRRRPWRYLEKHGLGPAAFLGVPVAETAQRGPARNTH